jgi:NADPH-dependent F420 reductase
MHGVIGLVGGTGPLGKGLALRMARDGRRVLIGSRTIERGQQIADWVLERAPQGEVQGATNLDAAIKAEVVALTIPYDGIEETLPPLADALAGKVVMCCINQIGFDRQGPFELQDGKPSSAQQCQALLPGARVVGAFHHVAAGALAGSESVDVDVLLSSDDDDAMEVVAGLVRLVPGMRPVAVGALRLAGPSEHFTAVLVAINHRHKVKAGVRLVGLVRED